jgi:hypothetical protein
MGGWRTKDKRHQKREHLDLREMGGEPLARQRRFMEERPGPPAQPSAESENNSMHMGLQIREGYRGRKRNIEDNFHHEEQPGCSLGHDLDHTGDAVVKGVAFSRIISLP